MREKCLNSLTITNIVNLSSAVWNNEQIMSLCDCMAKQWEIYIWYKPKFLTLMLLIKIVS